MVFQNENNIFHSFFFFQSLCTFVFKAGILCVMHNMKTINKEFNINGDEQRSQRMKMKRNKRYFPFYTHTHTTKMEKMQSKFFFITTMLHVQTCIHTKECKRAKKIKMKIENNFLFIFFSLHCNSLCFLLFFAYLVAKSLCTKFICSKYFIPEAICVAMYIKQP